MVTRGVRLLELLLPDAGITYVIVSASDEFWVKRRIFLGLVCKMVYRFKALYNVLNVTEQEGAFDASSTVPVLKPKKNMTMVQRENNNARGKWIAVTTTW